MYMVKKKKNVILCESDSWIIDLEFNSSLLQKLIGILLWW